MSLFALENIPAMFLSGVAVGGLLATLVVFLTSAILNYRAPEKSVADLLMVGVAVASLIALLKVEGII